MVQRWVFADEGSAESDSGDEEIGEEASQSSSDAGDEGATEAAGEAEDDAPSSSKAAAKKGKISISLGGPACHVCGQRGHNAGFIGSVYVDCPNKPCYLCKEQGHTTMTCPYRLAPDHDCTQAASANDHGVLAGILQRATDSRRRDLRTPLPEWSIDAAVLRLHVKRCTCLLFHPTRDNLVLSGDKHGQVAVWDHMKVYERTVWRPNGAITNNMAFLPGGDGMTCCSSSADGTLKAIDLETGFSREMLNMNPGGWTGEPSKWEMLYGLDVCRPRSLAATGDTRGRVHFVDARQDGAVATHLLHKKGNKVNTANFSPVDENLLVTASNDWTARLCDIRKMSSSASEPSSKGKGVAGDPMQLARVEHPKVVNSAYFSPSTGRKLLTTCIDNRMRVWDYLLALDRPPDREIVHSHDFNRYLTPFRAEWDPKDPAERLIAIGRYISEDFNGVALHPVDLFDAGTGRLLDQLKDPNLTTICPVNKIHPRLDLLVSGSSTSLYAWRPAKQDVDDESHVAVASAAAGGAPKSSADYAFYDASANEKKKRKAAAGAAEDSPDKKSKAAAKSALAGGAIGPEGLPAKKKRGAAAAKEETAAALPTEDLPLKVKKAATGQKKAAAAAAAAADGPSGKSMEASGRGKAAATSAAGLSEHKQLSAADGVPGNKQKKKAAERSKSAAATAAENSPEETLVAAAEGGTAATAAVEASDKKAKRRAKGGKKSSDETAAPPHTEKSEAEDTKPASSGAVGASAETKKPRKPKAGGGGGAAGNAVKEEAQEAKGRQPAPADEDGKKQKRKKK